MRMSVKPFERLASLVVGLVICAAVPLAHAGNKAQITFLSSSQTAGVGATVNFFVAASGDPTILYQWSFDGAAIEGATSQLLTIPNVQTSNQGSYQVVVTNDFGSSTSAVVVLQVVLTPAVIGWSSSNTVTEGSTASFSVLATGEPPLTFQWDFDGAAIAGATNSALSIPNAQSSNSGSYQVFITNSYGQTSSPILPLTVAVRPVVSGTTTSGPATLGSTATFTAFVEGTAPLFYQWYFEGPDGMTTNAILDATNSVLTITNVQATNEGSYQLLVTNSYGEAQSPPLPLQIVAGTGPAIGGQPSSQTVPQGFLATFQVLASGTAPLSYQWWWDGAPINAATNQTLRLLDVQPGSAGSYQVVVTNLFGGQTSAVATLSVSAPATRAPGVTLTPLLSLDAGTDGSQPDSSVICGSDGNLYVTTAQGGSNDVSTGGDGTVSKMDTNGNVLWTVWLTQATGANPAAGLVEGGGSVFYGTTVNGGAGFGTVFSVTSGGALTPLYSFTNGVDGANPQAALILGSDGCLYGCTAQGGTNDVSGGGDGTIFKMTTNGVLVWAISLNAANGRMPESALVQSSNGVLYGTTTAGGANNVSGGGFGTVFSITTNGVITSLYSFTGGTDGYFPQAGLAVGPDGGLYGTTTGGGNTALNDGLGFGTVFDITTNGSLTTLAAFDGTNGVSPQGTLALGSDDNFYGTTVRGGAGFPTGYGTIFRVTINGGLTSLLSFDGGADGAYPSAGLTQASPGVFYGTTMEGGTNDLGNGGDGTVFRFTSPAGPPSLANIGNQVLQVGQELIFTNQVFGGTPPVKLCRAASDPSGAHVGTNRVFCWAPACDQGSTTNLITIWAIDSSSPRLSNSMTFTVIVGQCVEVSVGSGPVQIGQSTCVPVNLFSTGSITNLTFSILTLADRFTNWTINPANGAIGLATVQDPLASQPQFNLATQTGQALTGSSLLGYICVEALDSGYSVFAPLVVTNIVALSPTATSPVPAYGREGELALIEGQPLLGARLEIKLSTNGTTPEITLYGNPGTNYFIQYTTNLLPPVVWNAYTNFTLTGLLTNFYQVSQADQMEFFRAYYFGPPPP
jgi:uncharacterized repeat protein (TIGR03803 family)